MDNTPKSTRGGKRPGAGRKKGSVAGSTILAGKAREKALKTILKDWDTIVDTKKRLALGTYYIEELKGKDGQKQTRIVYKAQPSDKALTDLIEMVQGKPKQTMDVDHSGEVDIPAIDQLGQSIKAILDNVRK